MSTSASISEIQRDKETFQDLFSTVVDTVTKRSKCSEVPEIGEWIKKVLEYNLQGGKLTRGLTTTFAYETLCDPESITEENLKISRILGWCVEMLHSYFLVMDDMMDGSTKRRGVPCWYRLPHVGLGAINDAILIHACIFELLKVHSANVPNYLRILDEYNEALLYTSMGQHLDVSMGHRSKKDYSLFTIERYSSIVRYKTAYYTYKLPVSLGMVLAGITDKETHKKAEEICLKIGHLFQMQDDFIDCYGHESVTGKIGTDIQERKCSWLAVQALQRCSPKQKSVFVSCYGSPEPAHIERIKMIYEELQLPAIYKDEERQRYDDVIRNIQKLPSKLSPDLFMKLLNMINKRMV